jgi:hypothetical protein
VIPEHILSIRPRENDLVFLTSIGVLYTDDCCLPKHIWDLGKRDPTCSSVPSPQLKLFCTIGKVLWLISLLWLCRATKYIQRLGKSDERVKNRTTFHVRQSCTLTCVTVEHQALSLLAGFSENPTCGYLRLIDKAHINPGVVRHRHFFNLKDVELLADNIIAP